MTQIINDFEIKEYVEKMSGASLSDIRLAFGISESTVRRTLARLEKSGKLRRFRGGAVAVPAIDTAYERRVKEFYIEKKAISHRAAQYVNNGSSIILLGGSTVAGMCPFLVDKEISVITNSLAVVDQLKNSPNINLIILGGIYNHDEYEFVGNMTNMGLRFMRADCLFTSCVGFSPGTGFLTNHINSVEFYQLCMKNAEKTFVLADSSKTECKGIGIFAGADEVDHLITDAGLSPETIDRFSGMQVQVELVDRYKTPGGSGLAV